MISKIQFLLGSGGMYTKVLAAKTAAKTNTNTVIVSGKVDNVLTRLYAGETIGINTLKQNQTR
jgi:glutamate 5-kinase